MEVWEEWKGPAGTRQAFFWDWKEAGKSHMQLQMQRVDEKQTSTKNLIELGWWWISNLIIKANWES